MSINIIGGAFFQNNVSAIVGELYNKDQIDMKDAAYSLFYSTVNIGCLFGPIISGFIVEHWYATKAADGTILHYGFRQNYIMAAIVMSIAFLVFLFGAPKWIKDAGKYPENKDRLKNKDSKKGKLLLLTTVEKRRMGAMGIVFFFAIIFWTMYFQTQTSVTLLINELVDLNVLGYKIPVSWMISFNGALWVIFGPLLGAY